MKKALILGLLCLLSVAAQAFTLTGKIVTESGEPLPHVSIFIKDAYVGTLSNLDGQYRLNDVPAGKHTLVVSHIGYETQTFNFTLEKDGAKDFVMKEQAVTLSEIFVTPTGETLERFILNQVVKHTQKLGKRTSSFDRTVVQNFEQRKNEILGPVTEPYIKTLNFTLGLMGGKALFHSLIDNPDLKVTVVGHQTFKNGSVKDHDTQVTSSTPKLTSAQNKSWNKVLGLFQMSNYYDKAYENIAKVKKNVDKLYKKNPDDVAKHFSYKGAYEEGNHVIHIIKYDRDEYHVADNCWQIRRIVTTDSDGTSRMTDFCEISKDFFIPSAYSFELLKITAKELSDDLKVLQEEDTSKMSKDELNNHNKQIQAYKKVEGQDITIKLAFSVSYKNFKLKTAK